MRIGHRSVVVGTYEPADIVAGSVHGSGGRRVGHHAVDIETNEPADITTGSAHGSSGRQVGHRAILDETRESADIVMSCYAHIHEAHIAHGVSRIYASKQAHVVGA